MKKTLKIIAPPRRGRPPGVTIPPGPDSPTLDRGYVRHPDTVWTDPTYATEPLAGVVAEWLLHLESRPAGVSAETIRKYRNSLHSFVSSLGDEPATLASLTRFAVDRWVSQQRLAGRSPEGIGGRLAALKTLCRAYLYLEAEYTTCDLLEKVRRPQAPEVAKVGLDSGEREAIFDVLRGGTYADLRNDAFIKALLSTGARFRAILELGLPQLDRSSGTATVIEKGGVERPLAFSPVAMKAIRHWLRVRRADEGVTALWTTEEGRPLTYWGGQSVFRRLKARSGVTRLHPHLLRHTFGQHAISEGADPTLVQDMLGHKTASMTTRYTRSVRAAAAAARMPRYSAV